MADTLTVSRKQRLRTLENQIRSNYEAFVATGFALKEIRDEELYKDGGFTTWEAYLKERVGKEFGLESAQVRRLILAAQVRPKLPDLIDRRRLIDGEAQETWSVEEMTEFARLAPKKDKPGQPYDVDQLDKRDVQRVATRVIAEAEKTGAKVTSSLVRKHVDEELGVKRGKQPEPEAKEDEEGNLHRYLEDYLGDLKGIADVLAPIPEDAWKLLNRKRPTLVKCLIAACDRLTDILRKVEG